MKKLLGEELDPPPDDIHALSSFFQVHQQPVRCQMLLTEDGGGGRKGVGG